MTTHIAAKPVSKIRYYASLLEALLLFVASVYITHIASKYAEINAGNHVEDIILSNTLVYDFEVLFVHGAIMLTLFVVALCVKFREVAPFLLKSVSFFIIVRAMFVSLTHIGPYPTKLDLESRLLDFITSGNDLFFSGHTGLPFLIALIFWNHLYVRTLFLAASVVFGVIVLLSHLHYSIDVFAAFFITYSIYHIAIRLFKRDYEYFADSVPRHK
jgi:membrane-associated phospholipid phosphatase